MGSAMLYFNPIDSGSIARAVLEIRDRREEVITCQQTAAANLWKRTWAQAAREWLDVFHEAAERWHNRAGKHCCSPEHR
jgi:hypothetical protein